MTFIYGYISTFRLRLFKLESIEILLDKAINPFGFTLLSLENQIFFVFCMMHSLTIIRCIQSFI